MPSTNRDEPDVLVHSPNLRTATWGDLFITEWTARATTADFRTVTQSQRTFASAFGERKHVALTLVQPAAMHAPSSESLTVLNDGMRDVNPRIKTAALTLTGDGFGAAIVRSVITAALAVQNAGYPRKVFSSTYLALEWLAPHVITPGGGVATAGQLARVLNSVATSVG